MTAPWNQPVWHTCHTCGERIPDDDPTEHDVSCPEYVPPARANGLPDC